MTNPTDEEPTESGKKQVVVWLDAEHYAALADLADVERLKMQDTFRRLIRFADMYRKGAKSRFAGGLDKPLRPMKRDL